VSARLAAPVCLLACLAFAASCNKRPPPVPPPSPADIARPKPAAPAEPEQPPMLKARGTITIAGRSHAPTWKLEVAVSDAERSRGLMFRKRLGDDAGMLFFMPRDYDWTFYMRNTYVALDMIFIASDWTVVGVVANTTPLTEKLRSCGTPSRYVLELNAHQARRNGIRPGTKLVFARQKAGNSP